MFDINITMCLQACMALLIVYALVVIAITALLIFFTMKIKSTAAKVILTIILVITGIGAITAGVVVYGLFKVGQSINESVDEQTNTDSQKQAEAKPKVKDSGESKEYFAPTDVVVGNGVEIQILKQYTVVDNTELEYIDDETYCAIDFRLKNTHTESQSIYSSQFELKQADGTVVDSLYPIDDALKTKFDYFTVELEPSKEITKSVGFDCMAVQGPLYFEYSGGELLNFSFFTENEEFVPIRYQVSFK